ncbi:MAG: 3-hydroxybutyryl-CoA dehydrogenase [Bacteroidota bacterium]
MEKISVIGAGTMGNGIAHVFGLSGYSVSLIDISEELVNKAVNTIKLNLDRQVKKGVITPDQAAGAVTKIRAIAGVENTPADSELVIEAVYEDKETKSRIYGLLNDIVAPDAIIATNTSSVSITELAAAVKGSHRFIGMHFMNPVPVMQLVEIIRGLNTSGSTYEAVRDLAVDIGKTPVEVYDYPGFISNRILMPMINEAVFALMEGVASRDDIDTVMKLGMNHPMGPLQLADFIGLDVCLNIMQVLYNGFSDSKYRPCPLLKKMVASGKLGRKSGEGFYSY